MPIDKLDTLVDGERISESTPKLSDSRRRARVISVQSLYENEMSGLDINIVTERLLDHEKFSKKNKNFCRKIIKTIEENSNLIDKKISDTTLGFDLIEMSSIDRKTYLSILSNADIGLVSLSSKMLSNNYPLKIVRHQ